MSALHFGESWNGSDSDAPEVWFEILPVAGSRPNVDASLGEEHADYQYWTESGGWLRVVYDPVMAQSTYWVDVDRSAHPTDWDAASEAHERSQKGLTAPLLVGEGGRYFLVVGTILDGDPTTLYVGEPVKTWALGSGLLASFEEPPDWAKVADIDVEFSDWPFWETITPWIFEAWKWQFQEQERVPCFDYGFFEYYWRMQFDALEVSAGEAKHRLQAQLMPPANEPVESAGGWRRRLVTGLRRDHSKQETDENRAWQEVLLVTDICDQIASLTTQARIPVVGNLLAAVNSENVTVEPIESVRNQAAILAATTRRTVADLSQAASFQAAQAEGVRAEQGQGFQRLLAIIAALLLAPGLIASLYGAEVSLPRQGTPAGTGVLFATMAATGLLTAWWLRWRDGDRQGLSAISRSQWPVLTGGLAALLVAVGFALFGLGLRTQPSATQSDRILQQLERIQKQIDETPSGRP